MNDINSMASMMPTMFMKMMPQGITMVLANLPKEQRTKLAIGIVESFYITVGQTILVNRFSSN